VDEQLDGDADEHAHEQVERHEGNHRERAAAPDVRPTSPGALEAGEAVLAGWRMLLDAGRLQDGEPHLAGTARPAVVRLSATTAAGIGASDGQPVTVSTGRGSVCLPLAVTEMPDQVVWLPLNSPGSAVHRQLGVSTGAVVQIQAGGAV
jgi:NADH-quinone oxidoreductase subunit G